MGEYESLNLDAKCVIDMGARLALKIHKRGEVAIKPGRHVFVPKVGMEERLMGSLKSYAGGKK